MNPVDLNASAYMEFSVKNDEKDAKLKLSDYVKIRVYKNIFHKIFTPN